MPGRTTITQLSWHTSMPCEFPQKCRLKIPHFVTHQSRPKPRGGSMSARTSRSSSTMACSASAVALCGGCRARRRARRRIRPARRAVPRPRRAIAVVWCVDPPVTGLQLSFLKPAEPEPRRSPGRDGGGRSREAPSRSIARGRASPGWPQGSLFRCSRRLNPGVSTGASMGQMGPRDHAAGGYEGRRAAGRGRTRPR